MTARRWPDLERGLALPVPLIPWARRLGLLGLCAAYIQGGLDKALDFPAAVAEMAGLGLPPSPLLTAAVIALELGGSAAVVSGRLRRPAALALALFTLTASLMANRFWAMPAPQSQAAANAFFEHLGLVGGFLLVAWGGYARQP